jgi:AcrR family transcriptional regulator
MTTTRPRNAAQTRADILSAARRRFGAEGYERTTLRAIAADVGVDAALVIRYFGSKQDLFAEAADFRIELPDLSGVDPDQIADILFPRFFTVWEEDETFCGALAGGDDQPDRRRHATAGVRHPGSAQTAHRHQRPPQQRIGLMGAFIIGLATTRYILANPPVANLSRDELSRWTAPIIRQLLAGPAPCSPRLVPPTIELNSIP